MWWINTIQEAGPVLGLTIVAIEFMVLVFCLTVHEFAHAYVSFKLGDPTAKALGRVTLNPLAHLDPLGTLLLLFVGFGWGKPVPFNPYYLSNPRRDSALIAFAGPGVNLVFALFFALLYNILPSNLFTSILLLLTQLNLVLCFFNLIPVNPLDGFKVVWGLLPPQYAYQWMDLAPYGIYILFFMIITNLTDVLVSFPVRVVMGLLVGN